MAGPAQTRMLAELPVGSAGVTRPPVHVTTRCINDLLVTTVTREVVLRKGGGHGFARLWRVCPPCMCGGGGKSPEATKAPDEHGQGRSLLAERTQVTVRLVRRTANQRHWNGFGAEARKQRYEARLRRAYAGYGWPSQANREPTPLERVRPSIPGLTPPGFPPSLGSG